MFLYLIINNFLQQGRLKGCSLCKSARSLTQHKYHYQFRISKGGAEPPSPSSTFN